MTLSPRTATSTLHSRLCSCRPPFVAGAMFFATDAEKTDAAATTTVAAATAVVPEEDTAPASHPQKQSLISPPTPTPPITAAAMTVLPPVHAPLSESPIKAILRRSLKWINLSSDQAASPQNKQLPSAAPRKNASTLSSKEEDTSFTKRVCSPRPFFFAMPWTIRNQFDRFNNEPAEHGQIISDSPDGDGNEPVAGNKHQLLPARDFMRRAALLRQAEGHSPLPTTASWWARIRKVVATRLSLPPSPRNEPSVEPPPAPKMKLGRKIALLGLHGWFPNRLLQRVIGDPRHTSDRMVAMMESALQAADPFPPLIEGPPQVYRFPLQGEGTVEERVERHYDELSRISGAHAAEGLASMEHLRTADSILIGAHSQGAPVSVILLARLIEAGIIDPARQQVTLLTVAGIFHGPFPPLRKNLVVQYVEADAARQLFDLNDPDSPVSRLFLSALDRILQAGVSMTCVASWLDQVVPFYSACLLGFDHPNIWRAVYINDDHYVPDFLTHIVETGLKIKNLGPEIGEPETHMILAHVSEYIAGSIYQHATHSSAYRLPAVYHTALEWMHLCPRTRNVPLRPIDHVRHRPLQPTVNPYYLPWLFRGWLRNSQLLANPLICDEFSLLHQKYAEWQPESKSLRDFKFKLEPLTLLSKM